MSGSDRIRHRTQCQYRLNVNLLLRFHWCATFHSMRYWLSSLKPLWASKIAVPKPVPGLYRERMASLAALGLTLEASAPIAWIRYSPPFPRHHPQSIQPTVAIWLRWHGDWPRSLIAGPHRVGCFHRHWLLSLWSSCGYSQTRSTSRPHPLLEVERQDICPGQRFKPC